MRPTCIVIFLASFSRSYLAVMPITTGIETESIDFSITMVRTALPTVLQLSYVRQHQRLIRVAVPNLAVQSQVEDRPIALGRKSHLEFMRRLGFPLGPPCTSQQYGTDGFKDTICPLNNNYVVCVKWEFSIFIKLQL